MFSTILVSGVAWPPYTPPKPRIVHKPIIRGTAPPVIAYVMSHGQATLAELMQAMPQARIHSVKKQIQNGTKKGLIKSVPDPSDATHRRRIYCAASTWKAPLQTIDKALEYITAHPGCGATEVAEALGVHRTSASDYCRRLVLDGKVQAKSIKIKGFPAHYYSAIGIECSEKQTPPTTKDKVLDFIRENPGCASKNISEAVGISREKASAYCRKLLAEKRIRMSIRTVSRFPSHFYWGI